MSATERAAIADTVAHATRAFVATASKLDGRLLLPFLRADSEFRAFDGERFVSYDEMASHFASPLTSVRAGEVRLDSLHVAVIGPEAAVVSAYQIGIWTDTSGRIDRFRERATYVWTRTADGWKILHLHNTETPDTAR
jgi:uncharacterized protein (TIGR02246 family)